MIKFSHHFKIISVKTRCRNFFYTINKNTHGIICLQTNTEKKTHGGESHVRYQRRKQQTAHKCVASE